MHNYITTIPDVWSMGSKYGEEWAKDKAPKAPEEPEKPAGVEGLKRD
jgi:hypothetical protein